MFCMFYIYQIYQIIIEKQHLPIKQPAGTSQKVALLTSGSSDWSGTVSASLRRALSTTAQQRARTALFTTIEKVVIMDVFL